MSSVINKVDKGLEKQKMNLTFWSQNHAKIWAVWELHIFLAFMLLPFGLTPPVVWWVFLFPPWSKEPLHGENDSSHLSVSSADSVPFPEFWSWHDLLLLIPQVFVTLKDIIYLMQDKNVTAFKILQGKHTFWIKLIFQITVSKSLLFLNMIFSGNFMVGTVLCGSAFLPL